MTDLIVALVCLVGRASRAHWLGLAALGCALLYGLALIQVGIDVHAARYAARAARDTHGMRARRGTR